MLLQTSSLSYGGESSKDSSILLEVLCPDIAIKSSIIIPRQASVADLKREACSELFLVSPAPSERPQSRDVAAN